MLIYLRINAVKNLSRHFSLLNCVSYEREKEPGVTFSTPPPFPISYAPPEWLKPQFFFSDPPLPLWFQLPSPKLMPIIGIVIHCPHGARWINGVSQIKHNWYRMNFWYRPPNGAYWMGGGGGGKGVSENDSSARTTRYFIRDENSLKWSLMMFHQKILPRRRITAICQKKTPTQWCFDLTFSWFSQDVALNS